MSTNWGWHCADDHKEEGWIFSSYSEDLLVKLVGVYRCWDQFRSTVNVIDEPKLLSERNRGLWDSFLQDHWNHTLLVMNEYGDLYPLASRNDPKYYPDPETDQISCECRGKPRATIHAHEVPA